MKKLLIISFFLFSKLFAQKVSENIQDATIIRTEDGIVAFGMKEESSKKYLLAIKYGNDLKLISQFKKELPEYIDGITCNRENEAYVFHCSGGSLFKPKGIFIRIDNSFNLITSKEYNKDDMKSIKEKAFIPYRDLTAVSQPLTPYFDKGKIFYPSSNSISSNTITSDDLWTTRKNDWTKKLDCNKIQTNDILLVTKKFVFAYVNDEKEKKSFSQYIFCLDKNSGDVIYKTQLNPDYQKVVAPSNALYNDNTGELIIAGNYADIDKKNKIYSSENAGGPDYWTMLGFTYYMFDINGIFLMKISKDGQITKSTFEKSSPYKVKNDILPINKYDIKSVFHKIIQLSSNEYVAIAENTCNADWLGISDDERSGGGIIFRPFGFSLIYFNNDLNISNTKFIEKEDFYKRNGLKNSPIFQSFNLAPCIEYPNYYYSKNDYVSPSKNHYSYDDCAYDEKQKNITLLYNNFIMDKLTAGSTTYYTVKINSSGDPTTTLVPNQQINAKQNSHVFLIDSKKEILFTPKPKEKKFSLEIINL